MPAWWYPPAAPPRSQNSLLLVLVIVIASILVVGAGIALFVFSLVTGPGFAPPSFELGPVRFVDGNASFTVTAVSPTTSGPFPRTLFEANLRIGSSTGTAALIVREPAFSVVVLSGQLYRIYWDDIGRSRD